MTDISKDERSIVIGTKQLVLPFEISDTLSFDDIVVVLMNPPSNLDIRDNVIAFTAEGEYVWRIEPPNLTDVEGAVVYTKILERDGELIAKTWRGNVYSVDPETGAIEYEDYYP